MKKKILGIIPARYASTRFPGKPLANIGGKPMIQRVYEQAKKALDYVVIATDDERIFNAAKMFNGEAVMTSTSHKTGTDRVAEAFELSVEKYNMSFDVILNIQGDEPFIRPEQLNELTSCFEDDGTQIATLVKPIDDIGTLFDPNRPKVVVTKNNFALYFSRNTVPYIQKYPQADWINHHTFFQHIGLYGFQGKVLREITQLEMSSIEIAESLEQNRWLENGYQIKVAHTMHETFAVDNEEDIERLKGFNLF